MCPSIDNARKSVTEILLEAGVVTSANIEAGLVRQRETGRRIGETLVELGFVSEEDIAWALARQLGLSFVDVRADALDLDLVRTFPDGVMRRLQLVPLVRSDERMVFAAGDPTDADALHEMERLAGLPCDCVAATPSAIEHALDAIFGARPARRPRADETEAGPRHDVLWERTGESFLQFHLSRALREHASEIHFVQAGSTLHVLHRVGPRLMPAAHEPADVMELLIGRLEVLGLQPATERECHRAHSLVCEVDGRELPILASHLVARDRTSVTLRLLRDPDERAHLDQLGLDQLGLDPLDLARLRGLGTEPSGLVLVCGPTGSGCSTTLAALLAELPTEERRWMVFARDQRRWPSVPGLVDVITGTPLRHWRAVSVAHGADGLVLDGGLTGRRVRAVLGSAAHGHWVLARTDWEDTFALLEWLGREPDARVLLSRRLRAVVQQRLVAPAGEAHTPTARRAVFEILFAGDALRAALEVGADAVRLRDIAIADGFQPLAERVRAGVESGALDPQDARKALA